MHYEELIREHAPIWPYPVHYGQEHQVNCDVLVLGGGIAGCWAAIGAARRGVKVALVEKGATKTSGAGGAGVDHWQSAVTNPACKISPEEFTQALLDNYHGFRSGITTYIKCRESYDCLLELEKMGVKVRDSEDEFKGAEFRDEKTKLLFAYDYTAKYTVRVWGSNVKPSLYKECRRLGVNIFDRIMVTSLLTKGGKRGARVVGATGVNVHTGEFYVFSGKASVLCMAYPRRNWAFSTELKGLSSFGPPNAGGDGHAIAWQAGAEFAAMEASWFGPGGSSPYAYPSYGVGNAGNTWYACNMVDANGKEIPWVDRDGRILKTVSERYRPAPGQKFFIAGGWGGVGAPPIYEYMPPKLITEAAGVEPKGDFVQPLYADLPSLPEMERKVIWGMMVAQESKTLIPIYRTYTQAGFNPDKDLLQGYTGGVSGMRIPLSRVIAGGGLIVDWNLKTSLDGLYAAGMQVFSSGCHANAAVTGRYAGRHAAVYALGAGEPVIDRKQVEAEKSRVFAPLQREKGMEWKELNAGVCRVMQDYCGDVKNEELMKLGLKWFDEIEAGEAQTACARNPHELSRLMEVFNLMTTSRIIIEACRARKASSAILPLQRLDYPEVDPPEWRKWITIKQDEGKVKAGELPLDYHGDMVKNYEAHHGR
jgi:succinate dehydrogenase/fumarate reductase flavoprotein subunit